MSSKATNTLVSYCNIFKNEVALLKKAQEVEDGGIDRADYDTATQNNPNSIQHVISDKEFVPNEAYKKAWADFTDACTGWEDPDTDKVMRDIKQLLGIEEYNFASGKTNINQLKINLENILGKSSELMKDLTRYNDTPNDSNSVKLVQNTARDVINSFISSAMETNSKPLKPKYPSIDRTFQKMLSTAPDGSLGPNTQSRLDAYKRGLGTPDMTNDQAFAALKEEPEYATQSQLAYDGMKNVFVSSKITAPKSVPISDEVAGASGATTASKRLNQISKLAAKFQAKLK